MKNETNTQHGNKGKTPWNKGNLNPYINARGYRCFKIEGKEIREHRMVMEQKLGRKLLSTELVHHLDGDKLNNHPDNLELRDWSEHTIEHHTGSTRKEYTKRTIEVMANYRWEVDRLLKENKQLLLDIELQKFERERVSKENEQLKKRIEALIDNHGLTKAKIEVIALQKSNAELLEALKDLKDKMGYVEWYEQWEKLITEVIEPAIDKAEAKNLGGS